MEPYVLDSASLRWSSSSTFTPTIIISPAPSCPTNNRWRPLVVEAAKKRSPETYPNGLVKKSTDKDLSRILRTESAIRNVERKAESNKYRRLWPKAVLEALTEAIAENRWESALKIFGLLRKQEWYEPRTQTYTKLLMMLGKCKQPKQASLLFEIMLSDGLRPTVDVYTALISVYGHSGLLDKAYYTICDMKSVSDCKPDVYVYSVFLSCCIKLCRFDCIEHILAEMAYVGVQCNAVMYNTIIDGYGKAKMFEQMESSLTEMIESNECLPDVYTLNSFLHAYGVTGKIEKMETWYNEFQLMGVMPDAKTFNILIKSYGKVGMFDKVGSILEFMKKRSFSPTIVTFNVVIEVFGKAGNVEKMEEIFQRMKHQGMKPNSVTYCSLVSAYSKSGNLEKVDSVLRQVENSDVLLDTPFFNSVISAYGQAGDLERMSESFLLMKEYKCEPDDITFATMAQAYKRQGLVEVAEDIEEKMARQKENSGAKLIPS